MRMLAEIARFPGRNFLSPSIVDVFMVTCLKKKERQFFKDNKMNFLKWLMKKIFKFH